LVLNDTAVVPTRTWGVLESGGQVEVTLVTRISENVWEVLVRPNNGCKKKTQIFFGNSKLIGSLINKTIYNGWRILFDHGHKKLEDILENLAEVNTPFYIKREIKLKEYQTIYARIPGSTQCPTAGLHFTNRLLKKINEKMVDTAFITLHIGGSVLPLIGKDYRDLNIYREYFEVSHETRDKIDSTKKRRRRVIAVGTTVVRALESAANSDGTVSAPNPPPPETEVLPPP